MNEFSVYVRRFFSGTFLSRVSGMGRDLVMAFAFGDHPSVAAFMVAFRLSNLLRRLLGEGPFQSAFIPHYEGLRAQDPIKAQAFFQKISLFLTLVLVGCTLFAEGGAWALLSGNLVSESSREVVALSAWLFPGILFICLYGLNISLLNCSGSFFVPSFAPFICNVIWIAAAFFLRAYNPQEAMPILAQWVVVGFIGQWLFTLPLVRKNSPSTIKEWLTLRIPPEIKSFARAFAWGAIGVGAVQINAFLDALFARYADVRGPAYLWYSIRLEQLALAIFGIACVSTIVPRLARAIKTGNLGEAKTLFSFSLSRIMAVMIPCTCALIVLGLSSVNLLYGHGHFSVEATSKTTLCLWSYALGLVPSTLVMLFSSVFFARNDFRTPMRLSLLTVGAHLLLNVVFVFVFQWEAVSTALATSLSAGFNAWLLRKKLIDAGWHVETVQIVRTISATFSASVLVLLCGSVLPWQALPPRTFSLQAGIFSLHLGVFCISLFVLAKLFKAQEILDVARSFFPRKKAVD